MCLRVVVYVCPLFFLLRPYAFYMHVRKYVCTRVCGYMSLSSILKDEKPRNNSCKLAAPFSCMLSFLLMLSLKSNMEELVARAVAAAAEVEVMVVVVVLVDKRAYSGACASERTGALMVSPTHQWNPHYHYNDKRHGRPSAFNTQHLIPTQPLCLPLTSAPAVGRVQPNAGSSALPSKEESVVIFIFLKAENQYYRAYLPAKILT